MNSLTICNKNSSIKCMQSLLKAVCPLSPLMKLKKYLSIYLVLCWRYWIQSKWYVLHLWWLWLCCCRWWSLNPHQKSRKPHQIHEELWWRNASQKRRTISRKRLRCWRRRLWNEIFWLFLQRCFRNC